jgi:RsmE family RNA methyltransferase
MLKLSQFQEVLECYHENIYAEQDVYYFFDEVQYAQDWDRWLKTIYDTQPDTKVIATGSASPALMKGSRESGAGRWSVIQVPTLSFYEYCELLGVERPDIPADMKVTSLLHKTQIERNQIMLQLSKVQNHFMRYLQVGGFPELALADNDLMAQQIMREDVVDKVLKRDLPSLYNIRNATELERIFLYLCNVSSEIVSIEGKKITVKTNHATESLKPWIDVLLAMPRPRVFKRMLPQLAQMGVREIIVIGASKVEKAYWGVKFLDPTVAKPYLVDGLMQAGTSILPKISTCRNFKALIESGKYDSRTCKIVAHPANEKLSISLNVSNEDDLPLLAIGSEGGWTDEEIKMMQEHGFKKMSLGPRILRTDTATIALLA